MGLVRCCRLLSSEGMSWRHMAVVVLVIGQAFALPGCASKTTARGPDAVSRPDPRIASHSDVEADGEPAQTPPPLSIRAAPDDPREPWSRNYGTVPPAKSVEGPTAVPSRERSPPPATPPNSSGSGTHPRHRRHHRNQLRRQSLQSAAFVRRPQSRSSYPTTCPPTSSTSSPKRAIASRSNRGCFHPPASALGSKHIRPNRGVAA
jgi:hypothetical protein